MKCLPDIAPINSVYIKSNSVAFDEEGEIDEKILDNWLEKYKIKKEFAHVSGHMGGYELIRLIKMINPQFVIPIHCENTEIFQKKVEKLGIRVILPKYGENCLVHTNKMPSTGLKKVFKSLIFGFSLYFLNIFKK